MARGAYLKFLFDDDVLHPFCVQYLVEALEKQSERGARLAFSPRVTIDADNHVIERINAFEGIPDRLLSGRELIRRMATTLLNPIGEFTTVLFRRSDVFGERGELQIMTVEGEFWRGLSDVALYIHLCANGCAVMVEDAMSYFRIHDQSNSSRQANPEWTYAVTDWKLVIDYAVKHNLLSERETALAYRKLVGLLRDEQAAVPALYDALAKVMESIPKDVDDRGKASWPRRLLRPWGPV